VGRWPKLYRAVAETGVPIIVLETNNDIEGKPQLELFRRVGRKTQLLSQAIDAEMRDAEWVSVSAI
jgi:hypothetical protein